MNLDYLQIDPKDNVLVALRNLEKGRLINFNNRSFSLKNNIPAKHKFFIEPLGSLQNVYMYGVLVGKVQSDVEAGHLMTIENTKHAADEYHYRNAAYTWVAPDVSKFKHKTFDGYLRSDGRVGTANYWVFIPTVFCENRNLDVIKEALVNELGYASTDKYRQYTHLLTKAFEAGALLGEENMNQAPATVQKNRVFGNVDGIKFLTHQGGCGGTRQDAELLSKLLAAYAAHPNVGGITILSLGCQHLQVDFLKEDLKKSFPKFDKPLLVFEQQDSKSEEALIYAAIRQTFEGLIKINEFRRSPAPLSQLTIGVKCGGSDGFSGITANPAIGYTSDLLVALGGKVLLAEFPELCGAEQNLIDRCTTKENAEKFIRLMEDYDAQAHRVGSGFYMNPSPGNIKDGLITDAIKSTGAAKKAGLSPITDVLDYTEQATQPGLSLVCTPGNDVEATTGKAASGATLILFTTGLGTPTGNPVTPVIKISSNTQLSQKMSDIIDINCGEIIDEGKTIEQMGEEILNYCIEVASGRIIPKAVQLNQDDFIPWKRGVSL